MNLSKCPNCGAAPGGRPKFCPECGTPLSDRKRPTRNARHGRRSATVDRWGWVMILGALVIVTAGYFVFKGAGRASTSSERPETSQEGTAAAMTSMLDQLPNDYATLVSMGNQFMDERNFTVAAEIYRRALSIDGTSPDVRTDYGACLHGMGLAEQALQEFSQVVRNHPEHSVAHYNLAIVYNELGQIDSARYYWQTFLDLEPDGRGSDAARQYLKGLEG